jgi:hypothetical protein
MMSADILNQIDDALERNRRRFDPFPEAWDDDRVYQLDNSMRVQPARTGIEEEAVEPEAVVAGGIVTAVPAQPWTTSGGDPWGDIMAVHRRLLADDTYRPDPPPVLTRASAEVYNREMARLREGHTRLEVLPPPVDELEEPGGARVTVMTEAEAAGFRAQQTLSLECSRSRPMCSGCDGLAMDHFPCMHDCHESAVHYNDGGWYEINGMESWHGSDSPAYLRSLLADDEHLALHARARAVLDFVTRAEVLPPHVDAALQPDLERCEDCRQPIFETEAGRHCCSCPEPPVVAMLRARIFGKRLPWWRRILLGGTR